MDNNIRETIKDINQDKLRVQAPNSIGNSGVMSPTKADMSQVGSGMRDVAEILSLAGDMYNKYDKKQKDEGATQGEILRRQGKTLEEAKKAGTYVGTGWQVADISIKGDELLNTESDNIDTTYYDTDPKEYAKRLEKMYSDLTAMAGDDPMLQKHINGVGKQMMGTLAERQMKAHINYNHMKTMESIPKMINSTLSSAKTPEEYAAAKVNVQALMNPKNFNLSPKDHATMMTGLAEYRMDTHNDPTIAQMLPQSLMELSPEDARIVEASLSIGNPALAESIMSVESSGRNVGADGKPLVGPIVTNADGSVRSLPSGKADRAGGQFQVTESTFSDPSLRRVLGVDPTGDFTDPAQVADFGKRFIEYNTIRQKGIPELVAVSHIGGQNFVDNWVDKLGVDPRKGEIDPREFVRLAGANEKGAKSQQSYKERNDYVDKVMGLYDKRRPQAIEELNALMPKANFTGEGAAKLNKSYTDMRERELTGRMVDEAISQGTINTLPDDKTQQFALGKMYDTMHKEVMQENPARPDEDAAAYGKRIAQLHFAKYVPELVQSGLVDKKLKGYLESTLATSSMMKGDVVNPLAIDAIQELTTLKGNSSEAYTMQYVAKENEGVVLRAMSYVDAGAEPTEAIRRSVAVQSQIDKGIVPPKVNPAAIKMELSKITEAARYGFWEKIVPDLFQSHPQAEASFSQSMLKNDLANAFGGQNGQRALMEVETLANRYMPDIQNEHGAVTKALSVVQPRMQIVLGQAVLAPAGTTFDELYGFPKGTLKDKQNVLHTAILEEIEAQADYPWYEGVKYDLKSAGESIRSLYTGEAKRPVSKADVGFFGREYSTFWGQGSIGERMRTESRGVPNYKNIRVLMNEDTGVLSVNVYKDDGTLAAPVDMRLSPKIMHARIKEILTR